MADIESLERFFANFSSVNPIWKEIWDESGGCVTLEVVSDLPEMCKQVEICDDDELLNALKGVISLWESLIDCTQIGVETHYVDVYLWDTVCWSL